MAAAQRMDVCNPSTGERVTTVETDTHDSANIKLERAYQFFKDTHSHTPLHERVTYLEKLVEYIKGAEQEFVTLMVQEGGKPWKDSEVEFHRAVAGIKLAIQTMSSHLGNSIPLGYQASSADRLAVTRVFPVGVVLAFSAFNHPLNLIVHQVIPAFAAGCPCVVKPAADTPLSCLAFVAAMHKIGIPEDYIQAIVTDDLDIATALVESNKISFFSFIGSARVGWMLRSKLKPGVRCALEHGGVATSVVSKNSELSQAVAAISKGAFYHAGQVCVSTQRVLVDAEVADTFTEQLVKRVKRLKVGDAILPDVDVGPLIRSTEIERIHSWVTEAVENGAKCAIGGNRIGKYFYAPTVLIDPPLDSKVNQQEIFGPVVCVSSYEKFDDALALANHDEFAFQASLFSNDVREITKAFDSIEASALMINEHTAFRDDAMPFAGLKSSGLGVGGIPYTMKDMQIEKMLVQKQ